MAYRKLTLLDTAYLQNGSTLKLLSSREYPKIVVNSIEPRLKTAIITYYAAYGSAGHNCTVQNNLIIGRQAVPDMQHLSTGEDTTFSRFHGILEWEKDRLIYRHNGIHNASIDYEASVSQEVGCTFVASAIQPSDNSFTLHDGAVVQFHPHLPPYRIIINGPQITFTANATNNRQPQSFSSDGRAPIAIGRSGEADIRLGYLAISNQHGIVEYDADCNQWVYVHKGDYPVKFTPAKSFYEEIKKENASISTMDRRQAQETLRKVNGLLEKMGQSYGEVRDLLRLEGATIVARAIDVGGRSEDSLHGYALWLQAAELLYHQTLSQTEKQKLDVLSEHIDGVAEDRKILRGIERSSECIEQIESSKALDQRTKEKYQALYQKGEVYVCAGFKQHHEVARIHKENGRWHLTEYNAGAGAKGDPNDSSKVLGMHQREIKEGTNIEQLIKHIFIKKMTSPGFGVDTASQAIEGALGATEKSHSVYPQNKGNCTTRSTREMIRAALSPGAFAKMHEHIHDANIATTDVIIDALTDLKTALEAHIGSQVGGGHGDRLQLRSLLDQARRH